MFSTPCQEGALKFKPSENVEAFPRNKFAVLYTVGFSFVSYLSLSASFPPKYLPFFTSPALHRSAEVNKRKPLINLIKFACIRFLCGRPAILLSIFMFIVCVYVKLIPLLYVTCTSQVNYVGPKLSSLF